MPKHLLIVPIILALTACKSDANKTPPPNEAKPIESYDIDLRIELPAPTV